MYIDYMGKIPHVLFQTTKKDPVDDYVLDMIQQQLDDTWSYEHYNDEGILNFFKMNPIDDLPDIESKFHSLKNGAHKADLFRYYYLYVKGGFYLDSDAMIYHNINDIIKDYEFVSVTSSMRWNVSDNTPCFIFQGIIGAAPKHDIMKQALYNVYNTDPAVLGPHYMYFCQDLFNIIKNYTNNSNIKLYSEKYGGSNGDETVDDNNNVLFKHYPRTKIVPLNLAGYTYSWGIGHITFNTPPLLSTSFGKGDYKVLDTYSVEANWHGYSHILTFNKSYTEYTSCRKSDSAYENGHLISRKNFTNWDGYNKPC